MEGLEAALGRARQAFDAERAQTVARHDATDAHDQLRKLSPGGGYEGLSRELRKDWRWHARNEPWFRQLPFEQQREHMMSVTGPRGPDGRPALSAAGCVLLDYLAATGQRITATKADVTRRRDSPAVAFLMEHLPSFDEKLRAEAVVRNAAYTIVTHYKTLRRK